MSRGFKAIQVIVVCSLLLFLFVPIQSQQVAERADNQIIVKLKPGIQSTDIDAIQRSLNASVIRHFRLIGAELWKISGVTVEDAIARYASDPRIEYIEPDYIVHALEVIPNDPSFNLLWGLHNTGQSGGTPDADIDAPEAWEIATGDDVVLGVIDTGVDWSHADLSSNIWTNPGEIADNGIDDDGNGYVDDVRGWDFVNNDNNPTDDNGHGTHVSGTIAAVGNNGIGVAGVSWSAKIMPLKFLDYSGGGYTSGAILAVEYATMMGARFTNNSWGGGAFSQALRDAIEAAGNAGMLFVAAAGNSADDNDLVPHYPSSYDLDNIIAVAATDHNDALADFSCYGATSVDLAAPGVNIYSCLPGGSYGYGSGTSMATPQVSGAVSLFWSQYPSTPHLNVRDRMFASVDILPALVGSMVTGGRLNVFKMMAEPDVTPPAAVSDLATTDPASNAITLTWTATGDDGASGTASSYDIRYSLSPIDDGNFGSANEVAGEPHPQAAGSPEMFTVHGLDFSTTYYFAVKALDEWGNPSPASNSPSGTTLGMPHIVVSPDALSEDLLTGATSTQNLTIENTEANTTLDFCISIEGVEASAARVDVIGGESVRNAKVIKGRPLSGKELETLRASFPGQLTVPSAEAVDKGAPSQKVASKVGALERIDGEEVFGSAQNQYFAGPRSRGNIFACTSSTALLEHRFYMNPSVSTQLWFLVYEGESQVGTYSLVSASDVTPAGPGEAWYSSGDINVPLEAGKYYLIFASFEQESYYYNEQGISPYPIPASFGALVGAAGWDWAPTSNFPPDPVQSVPSEAFGEPVAYYQTLVTGVGTSWLSVAPECGTVPGASSMNVEVTFDAAGLDGGDYFANISVASNDSNNPVVTVPATLHVTGAPDIAVVPAAIDYGPVFIGGTKLDTLVISNEGTDVLSVSEMVLDNADFSADLTPFDLSSHESRDLVVAFAPSTVGAIQGTLTITTNDPDEGTVVVELRGEGVLPPVMVCPPSDTLSKDLFTGETWDTVLTLCNTGQSDLNYCISVEGADAAAARGKMALGIRLRAGNGDIPDGSRDITPAGIGRAPAAVGPSYSGGRVGSRNREIETPSMANKNASDLKILLLHSGAVLSEISDLLLAFPDISVVDVFDGGAATPTLATLAGYDAVILINGYAYLDPVGIGDVLADYVDAGGGVIMTLASFISGWEVGGRFASGGYYPFTLGSGPIAGATLANFDPNHPIMAGVTTAGGDLLGDVDLSAGAEWVADWDNGEPFIATQGERVAAVNIFLSDGGYWTGDIPLILHNAVLWSAGTSWLTVAPECGTVPPNSCADITVTFDAADLYGGDYYADLAITGNDPVTPECRVPAHLHVTGAPDIAVAPPAIDYGPVFIGGTKLDTLVISNAGTDNLSVTELVLDNADFSADLTPFDLAPRESRDLVVSFAPTVEGLIAGTLTITSNDPDEGIIVVQLQGEGVLPPEMVCPPSDTLSKDLFTGETRDTVITLCNNGETELSYCILVEETAGPVSAGPAARAGSALKRAQLGGVLGTSTLGPQPKPVDREPRALQAWETLGDRRDLTFTPGKKAQESTSSVIFEDDFEDGDYDDWVDTGMGGTKEVTSATAAKGVYSFHQYDSPGGHLSGIYHDFGAIQPGYVSFYMRSGSTNTNTAYFLLRDSQGDDVIWFFAYDDGLLYVNDDVGGDHTYPYTANTWYHIQFKDIDFVSKTFDYYVNEALVKADIPFRNAYAVNDFYRLDLYNWSAGSQAWWDEVEVATDEPAHWLRTAPVCGAVPPNSCADITVTFDAADMYGGDYYADLVITGNDPVTPECRVPAHLHVTGAPDIAVAPAALDYGPLFIGATKLDTLVISNEGTDVLHVSEMTLDNADFTVDLTPFDLAPEGSWELAVAFAPSVAGLREGTLAITSDDPDEGVVEVALRGEGVLPPEMVCPPSDTLSKDLFTGGTWDTVLTLCNEGGSDLDFSVTIGEGALARSAAIRGSGGGIPLNGMAGGDRSGVRSLAGEASAVVPLVEIGKGQEDTRTYPTMDRASGGPDPFGYRWRDSNEPGGPVFDWIDVSGGASIGLGDDNFSTDIPLGFTFSYYGQEYTTVGVGSNGWLSFNGSNNWYPSNVPQMDEYAGAIAPFARDLDPRFANYVRYQTVGTAPSRRFVVEYNDIPDYGGGSNKTFEVIFYESSNAIRFQYMMAPDDPVGFGIESPDQTMGMGNAGAGDLFISPALVEDNYAIEFAATQAWLGVDPLAGTVPAGGCLDLVVTMDATGLNGGDYDAAIVIVSNDPVNPECRVSAHLHVTGAPDIAVAPAALDYGPLFIGATKVDTLVISNEGTDVLHVSEMTLDNADFSADLAPFDLAPEGSRELVMTFGPSVPGLREGTLTITSDDPDEGVVEVALRGEGVLPPEMVCPPSDTLSKDLFTGGTWDTVLTLCNDGEGELEFSISSEEATAPIRKSVNEAIASIVGRSGVLKGEIRIKSANLIASGEAIERVYRNPGDVAHVKLGPAAGPSVLLLAAEIPLFVQDVQDKLLATGKVGSVTFIDVGYMTPTLVELQAFDAVMVWSDYPYADNVTLGNNLADYVDGGGGVVCAMFEVANMPGPTSYYLNGRWESEQYYVFLRDQFQSGYASMLGAVAEPAHPVMEGVTSFYGGSFSFHSSTATLTSGSTLIASWSDGVPLVAVKEIGRARRVDLDFYPVSSDANSGYWQVGTDGDLLMVNALAWVARGARWLSAEPSQGAVAPNSCMDITVTFDAAGLQNGDYYANLVIAGNDPVTPECRVPAHLSIQGNGSSMILLTGCGSGWYLKSWNVDTPVDSTTVLLKDIMSCLAVALGYDGGGLSYYPSIPPQFNTLKTMDHLHGYWFRMACDDILMLQGTPVSIETPIPLSAGWNVASYLPAQADSTVHALSSIMNNVSVVLGFECGGLSYYPSIPPQFNTLQVMKPTCGYWIKMGTADTLIYPETVVYESPPVATAMMLGGEGYGGDAVSKVLPTREWINVWGEGVRMDGTLLRVGTIVKAVDEDGVVCGQCAVRSAGDFGLMAIYKDDPETEVDEGAEAGETVTLYLGDVKVSGGIRWTELGDCVNFKEAFSLADGNVETLPVQYALLQNYPNPFNPTTSIRYELPRDSYVELVIYNVQGQVVRELVKGMQKAQRYVVEWDGKNAQGSSVASGIYFYRIKAGEFVNTKKMVLLR